MHKAASMVWNCHQQLKISFFFDMQIHRKEINASDAAYGFSVGCCFYSFLVII